MGSKRGSSAVLEAPEESVSTDWHARGPAPAGALQRKMAEDFDDTEPLAGRASEPESYVPRRAGFLFRVRILLRSLGGRIVLGTTAFLALTAAIIGIAAVRYYLLHNDHFVITTSSDIQVTGNQHLTRSQVLSVFGADLERNIFKVPLAERRDDLERLPWVEHATVMRLLPDRLRISIVERTPVAFVRQGTQIGLVDASGVLLDMPSSDAGNPSYSFPVLTGIDGKDPLTTRAARMEVYSRFLHELDSTGGHYTQQLSEVDVSNPEDVKALIAVNGADIIVHFGDEDFLNRFKAFQQHLPEWQQKYPKLASADMRYQDQVVLEMQHGAETPLASAMPADTPAVVAPDAAAKPAVTAAAKPAPAVVAKPGPKAAARPAAKPAPHRPAKPAKKVTA